MRKKTMKNRPRIPLTRGSIKSNRYFIGGVVGLVLMGACGLANGSGGSAIADDFVAPKFVTGFEDVPLPRGMTNLPGSQTVFDSQAGRIIDATATGPANDQFTSVTVRNFYRETLPQLGWQSLAPAESPARDGFPADRFVRDGEVLVLQLKRVGDVIQARFTLTPMP